MLLFSDYVATRRCSALVCVCDQTKKFLQDFFFPRIFDFLGSLSMKQREIILVRGFREKISGNRQIRILSLKKPESSALSSLLQPQLFKPILTPKFK